MRRTPVILFMNKMDRPALDPFDLIDNIEKELEIQVCPLSWPISSGPGFRGVFNIFEQKLMLFTSDDKQTRGESIEITDIFSGRPTFTSSLIQKN
jgi:peptide chain release factor 3